MSGDALDVLGGSGCYGSVSALTDRAGFAGDLRPRGRPDLPGDFVVDIGPSLCGDIAAVGAGHHRLPRIRALWVQIGLDVEVRCLGSRLECLRVQGGGPDARGT